MEEEDQQKKFSQKIANQMRLSRQLNQDKQTRSDYHTQPGDIDDDFLFGENIQVDMSALKKGLRKS